MMYGDCYIPDQIRLTGKPLKPGQSVARTGAPEVVARPKPKIAGQRLEPTEKTATRKVKSSGPGRPPKWRQPDDEEVEEWIQRKADGESYREIGDDVGYPWDIVRNYCRRHGG